MSVFITGSSGFVGYNLIESLGDQTIIKKYSRGSTICIEQDVVIHLAGKAHDLKKVASYLDYYIVNTEFTKEVFDKFLASEATVFITLSSVKAVADKIHGELTEENIPNPITHYGKSKLLAEEYILSKPIPNGKRVYILRPCMIHGPNNKGNLNLLYNLILKGIPWPLGLYENKRSYLSIDNLSFIIKELIKQKDIPSGVYNVADDLPLSTIEVIHLIANSCGKPARIIKLNKSIISKFAQIGDIFRLPLNSERLEKLTESYVVSNKKIIEVIGKPLPISSLQGLIKTFKSFSTNA
jgi:nucleoside-diphosphate-sugar epimerase